MAALQSKRSVGKKQLAISPRPAGIFDSQQSANPNPKTKKRQSAKPKDKRGNQYLSSLYRQRAFHFPQAKGKVLEDVLFTTSPDYDAINLSFRDKTCLDLVIDACFSVQADYLDRKTGDHRVLKRWPPMHAVRFRPKF